MLGDHIFEQFEENFGDSYLGIRSPGRLNLIGEHTDYNDGFVMPGALDLEFIFAIAPADGPSRIRSYNFQEKAEVEDWDHLSFPPSWIHYFRGVVKGFQNRGIQIPHFHCVFGGDIPRGAGLSSSAAISCGFAYALNHIIDANLSLEELAIIAHEAEFLYVGVQCGIMDHYANLFSHKGQLVKLDCRDLSYSKVEFDQDHYELVLLDTGVSHDLIMTSYNNRRNTCKSVVQKIHSRYPEVRELRDVTLELLSEFEKEFTPEEWKRGNFVVRENERVNQMQRVLKEHDYERAGVLISQSHEGLSRDYQVSCPELDFLVSEAQKVEGVLGARMMGAGFGGCTLNLVEKGALPGLSDRLAASYEERFKRVLNHYEVHLSDGTTLIQ